MRKTVGERFEISQIASRGERSIRRLPRRCLKRLGFLVACGLEIGGLRAGHSTSVGLHGIERHTQPSLCKTRPPRTSLKVETRCQNTRANRLSRCFGHGRCCGAGEVALPPASL